MSSTDHTPSEPLILASLGGSLLDAMVQNATFIFIYGVFVLLFAQMTATFLRRHRGKKPHLWMFLASALNFILATIHLGALCASSGTFVHSALVGYQDIPLAEKVPLVNGLLLKPAILAVWMASFEPIISDSIVVWRAVVLLQHRRRLAIPALFLLLCSVASALVNSIFSTTGDDVDTWLVNTTFTASVGLSLGTNIVATSLISYVYWLHRGTMASGLGENHRPTQSERTMALLVESGILFCLPQAVNFIMAFFPDLAIKGTAGHYAWEVFNGGYFAFAAMYPTLVAVLINSRCTIDETYSFGASLSPISKYMEPSDKSTLPHITFALPEPVRNIVETSEKVEEKGTSTEI